MFRKIAVALSALAVTAAFAGPFSVGAKWADFSAGDQVRSSWG